MKKTKLMRIAGTIPGILAGMVLSSVLSVAAAAENSLPAVSSDGLHLVPHSKVRVLYVKPGATLDAYTQVKILDCFVQFIDNYQREYNMNEVGLQGRVTTQDMENIKTWLSAQFTKVFTEVLQKAGHEVVDTVGPNVLLLRPAIINLDVTAPDTNRMGMGQTFVSSAGQMTLYLELYDSATSELLARAIDPEAGQEGGMGFAANRVTNGSAADQILRGWAELLAKHLVESKQSVAGQ